MLTLAATTDKSEAGQLGGVDLVLGAKTDLVLEHWETTGADAQPL